MIGEFVRRPQRVWLRRALFQIHLWAGLIGAIYLIAVGITGSILVFKAEAVESLIPTIDGAQATPQAPVSGVLRNLREKYPKLRLAIITLPTENVPVFQTVALRREPVAKFIIASDPQTGEVAGDVNLTESWLGFVHNLHIFLLLERPGFVANGVGAILLLVLCVSGLVLWWPGIARWKTAFVISMKSGWKRVNWDLHNTVGFYLLAFVSFWAISTVYFVWPEPFVEAVSSVSRVTIEEKPKIVIPQRTKQPVASIDPMIERARKLQPALKAVAVGPAADAKTPVTVFMLPPDEVRGNNAEPPDGATRVYFDPVTGEHVATIEPPRNRTLGDWIVWSMEPFHFGDRWGFAIKVLWAILGVSIPLLTITGVLMYWNRVLAKLWRSMRSSERAERDAGEDAMVAG
jgi:uncharacterized iron-regulated membrane protein